MMESGLYVNKKIIIFYEENFNFHNQILSDLFISTEKHQMSLLSYLFRIWSGSGEKTWCPQGQSPCGVENFAL